ncbi:DNA resolvase [Burkholderia ubonensis]|uniref:recombinase family protein n=1 Tax=Burkholderia ubonensis TaxID=101571 RepID=UPI00075477F9|nr:recombinase family protein [Burkholderia ubonensis]KVV45446.1 DNA resolvase [Burkholderia ubonensis]KVW31397.1 DNA resolvase [Burkholderia ubonensis]KVW47586.1 DNA resolvase [Burkholderia ubonensis]
MKIGYARVSTEDQNVSLQQDALSRAGCDVLFTDHGISGSDFYRPGLNRALKRLKEGDTLVVWRLDRLGRSIGKLIALIDLLGKRKVGFVSLNESIDTTSASGTLVFHMMAALAEFERHLISERTRAGLIAAKARGKRIGRRPSLTAAQCRQVQEMLRTTSVAEIARRFHVHPVTVKRAIKVQRVALQKPVQA